MPSRRLIARVLALCAAGIFVCTALHFHDPFASLGAVLFELARAPLTALQRGLIKLAPDVWTFLVAPILRLPLGLLMLIPAAELFLASRKP